MKVLLVLFYSCFILCFGFAQENSLLWEISKKRSHTSYLFGTIHSKDERVQSLAQGVLPYLNKSKAYAGEIILDPTDALAILPYLYEKNPDKRCKQVLNDDEYEQISSLFSERIGPEMQFLLPFMSPYMAALMLSIPASEFGEASDFLDVYLQEKADSLGHELISLETIGSQFAYIQAIEIQRQKEHLLQLLLEKNSIDDEMEAILFMYLSQDLVAIAQALAEASDQDPLFSAKFINERNLIHANGMMKAMKEFKTFTALGAAHLPGEKGVISLLREAGYTVRAIPLN